MATNGFTQLALSMTMFQSVLAGAAHLPDSMRCNVSGHAGCSNDICVGAGTSEPSVKLKISRRSHSVSLNGIAGSIDRGVGDPYAEGSHHVSWTRDLIAYDSYSMAEIQPGRVFVTFRSGNQELEFHCLGSLYAK